MTLKNLQIFNWNENLISVIGNDSHASTIKIGRKFERLELDHVYVDSSLDSRRNHDN